MMIEDNKKYRIAELERQKISIEDELQFTTDVKRVIVLAVSYTHLTLPTTPYV